MKSVKRLFGSLIEAVMIAAVIGLLIGACTSLEKPQGATEQVMYAEAGAQGAIKTLVDLTCTKYAAAGVCADPGKPLHPARSALYLESIAQARLALRAVSTMPAAGVGNCLGQQVSQLECLRLAQSMLAEVQRVLVDVQKKGGA